MLRRIRMGAFGVMLLTRAVPAAPQSAPTQEEIRQAQTRWAEGKKSFEAGNYEAARVAFRQAYAAYPAPALLQNLGEAELRLGRHVEAARHLSQYLRQANGVSAPQRDAVAKSLEKASSRLATLIVDANLNDVEIKVDGELIGKTPLQGMPWYVEPGRHVIVAHKDGYWDATEATEIWMGSSKKVSLAMKPMSESARVPSTGSEGSSTTPGAIRPRSAGTGGALGPSGTTASAAESDPSGSDTPSAGSSEPAGATTRRAFVEPSANYPTSSGSAARTVILVGEGLLTAAGIAVGAAYLVGANNAAKDVDTYQNLVDSQTVRCSESNRPSACDGLEVAVQDRDMNTYVSAAGFIGAGLAATAFVTTMLVWKPTAHSSRSFSPKVAVAPGGGITSISWEF